MLSKKKLFGEIILPQFLNRKTESLRTPMIPFKFCMKTCRGEI